MRTTGVAITSIAVLAMMSGCVNNKVGWTDDAPDIKGSTGGIYAVGALSGSDVTAKEMERVKGNYNLKTALVDGNAAPTQDSALPIAIKFSSGEKKNVTGTVGAINNFFSIFTLGIWPYVKTEERPCSVEVKTPRGGCTQAYKLGYRTWSSFILPIAALPCPGWGTWRSTPYMSESNDGSSDFERDAMLGMATTLLTDEFYRAEMAKYVERCQKDADLKKRAIKGLQAVLDAD